MSRAKKKDIDLFPLFVGKKTPEQVKAILATLPKPPRIPNAVIDNYCASAGRRPKTAEALARVLKSGKYDAPPLL